jgi:hypothetical protein
MSDDGAQAMREDYWSGVEREGKALLDHLRDDADEWDVRGAVVTGEDDDGTLYLLALRTRVGDAGLLLSERFYRFDPATCEGSWTGNGVTRRVQGSLIPALKVLYAAMADGEAATDDPMLLDSREEGLDHGPELLTAPAGDLASDEDDGDGFDQLREDADTRRSVEGDPNDQPATVTCEKCDAELSRSEAVNMGSGLGVDLWICDGSHRGDPS